MKQSVLSNKKKYFNRNAGRYANVNIHWQFTRNNSWWALDPAHFDPSALSSRPGCNCNSLMLLSLALLFHYSTLHNWVKSFLKPNSNNWAWFGRSEGKIFFNTKLGTLHPNWRWCMQLTIKTFFLSIFHRLQAQLGQDNNIQF